MKMSHDKILQLLDRIDPARCNYEEWAQVGMALQLEGLSASDWDQWSKRDPERYHAGECFKKWGSFAQANASSPVTAGTISYLASQHSGPLNSLDNNVALDWDAVITVDALIDAYEIAPTVTEEPDNWSPANDLLRYLSTLFESSEHVGYVTSAWQKGDKWLPGNKGAFDRTAGQLIQELSEKKDVEEVLGTVNPEAGAWIRFNPLDGQGVTNNNVADYRYALVESDSIPVEMQNSLIRELQLPVACLVHSGRQSLHAIVRIDAVDKFEYRKRVDYLYAVCKRNGLDVDTQNSNPSRLSRIPGVMRDGKKQYLVDTNLGFGSWVEWHDWAESVNDELPDAESLADVWDDMPPLAPTLIDKVLRQGHKMLIAGPSKAGKSFLLIQMCIAIAEGRDWLGFNCTQGKVLYVNLELDRASCLHRFRDVYDDIGCEANNINNIDIWNLRGNAVPMDKLAPKLIRRAKQKEYIAVVIDPIYKVITGDENSASEMAHFTNQFDKIANDLGCAVIYCHHHSKGYQGSKRSMDRASGSGVFARDPDAILDLIELPLDNNVNFRKEQAIRTDLALAMLEEINPAYFQNNVWESDKSNFDKMQWHVRQALTDEQLYQYQEKAGRIIDESCMYSAWRIETTLREFPYFEPVNMWFQYPTHKVDTFGILKELTPESDMAPWQKAMDKRKSPEVKKEKRSTELEIAFTSLEADGKEEITTSDLAEQMGVTVRTVSNRIKEHGGFERIKNGPGLPSIIKRKEIDDEE